MGKRLWLVAIAMCVIAGYSYGSVDITSTGTINIPATNQNGDLESKAVTASGIPGSITQITVQLNNWTDSNGDSDREMMLVFQPTGCNSNSCLQTFQFLGGFGYAGSDNLSNYTVTFADSGTYYAPDVYEGANAGDEPPVNNATYKPTVNEPSTYCSDQGGSAAQFASPAPSTAPCANVNTSDLTNDPSNGNSATFANSFSGSPNGTWTLYVWTNGVAEDNSASIGSWTLSITTASATNTTTSLSSNQPNNEANENLSVTLTATVSPTPDGGTVTFTDNGSNLSCSGGNPAAVSGGTATCTTRFSTEGNHPLEAAYNGDSNFAASHGTLNFFVDHPTTSGGTGVYCNTGTITINTNTQPGTTPYPQHITVPSTSFTISDISLTLNSITTDGNGAISDYNFLLVDPNGHKFIPLAGAGGQSAGSNVTFTLSDGGSAPVPNPTGSATSGTYLPTDDNVGLSFPSGTPSSPYSLPQNQGGATFDDTFGGANPSGQWSLYVYDTSGQQTGSIGGYCLNITTSNAAATTTSLVSSPNGEATTGQQVTFTATVKSGGNPISSGTVTFKENGTVLSGPTGLNGSGQATFQTASLSEGIHTITADYSGVTGMYQVSSGPVTIEIDTATTNPTAGVYCNPGGISISSSNQGTNPPLSPYPSRVDVTGVAGTLNTVKVELNNFGDTEPDGTVMLLEGPTATNIVFWNNTGADGGFSGLNLTLADSAGSPIPESSNPVNNGTYYPTANTSPNPTPVFPVPGPASLSFAPPEGIQTFTSAFQNINPNGFWSLFAYDRFGGQTVSINNWCLNVVNNPPVVTLAKVHNGTFTQGDSGDTYTITVANPSGPGPTAGTMTLTDTLPTGMTATGMVQASGGTGSDWSCSVSSNTTPSCTRTTAMPPGESDTITLTVAVSYNASTATNGSVNNVSLSGGGISGSPVTSQDTQTVQAGPGYTLNLSVNTSGAGTVTADPTNSPGLTAGHYVPGTPVTLTATATSGYGFSSWSGSSDLSSTSTNPATVTMNSPTESVTANFVWIVANIAATAGTPQSLSVGRPFATLQATVTDTNNVPVQGVLVTFAAPTSGASVTFPNGNTAVTNAQGVASIKAIANASPGSYQVDASVQGVQNPAVFSLTNKPGSFVTPAAMSYGMVTDGGSKTHTALLYNHSTAETLSSISSSITGSNAGDFMVTSSSCGSTLSPGSNCNFVVMFKPSVSGSESATLNITDDESTFPVTLSGTGVASSVSPAAMSYGTVTDGVSKTHVALLHNRSTADTLSSIASNITGPNAGDFMVTSSSCGSTLGAGLDCNFVVAFKPTISGSESATLNITDNEGTFPVALSGTGVASSVSPSAMSYGTVSVGTSKTHIALLHNRSAADTLSSIASSITGPNAGDFMVTSSTCGSTLGAGLECNFVVRFKPTLSGPESATLNITDNEGTFPVALSGTGQ